MLTSGGLKGRSVLLQSDGLLQGLYVRAYHLIEGVQFLERILHRLTQSFEPLLEDLGGEEDATVVGGDLVQFHGASVRADATLPRLRPSYLQLRPAREAFYPAVEFVEDCEELFVFRPVCYVTA